MKFKTNSKNVLAILFVLFITICGSLSLLTKPVRILGGLARGYIDSPQESSIIEKIDNAFSVFDTRISEYFILHDPSIHAYGGIQRLLGRTLIDDTSETHKVVKLNNGYLTFKSLYDSDLTGLTEYLLSLKSACNSTNTELLYINTLSKNTTLSELLPEFYPHCHTSNLEEIKPLLKNNGIAILDFEDLIAEQNIDKYSLFFITDHHWKPQTGIWVSQNICTTLNKEYGWNINTSIFDITNYSINNYSKIFLGSQGKRVGAMFTEIDDFEVIEPVFATNLTVLMNDINCEKTGSFSETLLYTENITPKKLLNQETTAYNTYMDGNHDLVKITNNNISNGKKALIIMDSMGCVVAPYLALSFEKLDCIDIRSYKEPIEEYIQNTSPDIVIYAISSHQ